jgi:hypothetical protein
MIRVHSPEFAVTIFDLPQPQAPSKSKAATLEVAAFTDCVV